MIEQNVKSPTCSGSPGVFAELQERRPTPSVVTGAMRLVRVRGALGVVDTELRWVPRAAIPVPVMGPGREPDGIQIVPSGDYQGSKEERERVPLATGRAEARASGTLFSRILIRPRFDRREEAAVNAELPVVSSPFGSAPAQDRSGEVSARTPPRLVSAYEFVVEQPIPSPKHPVAPHRPGAGTGDARLGAVWQVQLGAGGMSASPRAGSTGAISSSASISDAACRRADASASRISPLA